MKTHLGYRGNEEKKVEAEAYPPQTQWQNTQFYPQYSGQYNAAPQNQFMNQQ